LNNSATARVMRSKDSFGALSRIFSLWIALMRAISLGRHVEVLGMMHRIFFSYGFIFSRRPHPAITWSICIG
jgi:hypothetical protein